MSRKKMTVTLPPIDMSTFVPETPTKVLTATRGQTIIVSKLYGPVDADRLALEQQTVEHRAEQLNPVPKRPERIERDPGMYGREREETKFRHRHDRADRAGQPFDQTDDYGG